MAEPLTEEQRAYWEYRLECAERAAAYALKMLTEEPEA